MTDAKCFKCNGPIKAVQDVDGGYVGTCMNCAAIQPYETVNDVQPEERGQLGRPSSDWVAVAKGRMNALVREITAMDAKRAEAEAIARALAAYGEKNIPSLPWKAAKSAPTKLQQPRAENKPWADDEPRLIDLVQQGASIPEIAAELNRTVAAVNTRMFEMRRRGDLPAKNAA